MHFPTTTKEGVDGEILECYYYFSGTLECANCSLDPIVWASYESVLMAPGYLLQSADLSGI